MLTAVLSICLAYLLGSIPTGYWVAKAVKGIDIRQHGSGSTGATNVLRTVGKPWAAFVFLADIGKGYLAVWISIYLESLGLMKDLPYADLHLIPAIVAIIALVGHSKSIFLNFSGGKSAATALGAAFAMNVTAAALSFAIWLLVLALTRIVSLSSIIAVCASAFLMALCHGAVGYIAYCACGAVYVTYRHQTNIKRMLSGTEPRIGEKSKDAMAIFLIVLSLTQINYLPQVNAATKPKRTKNTESLTAEEVISVKVYKATNKAVVYIASIAGAEDIYLNITPKEGSGSGTIIDQAGHIITNNHVVHGATNLRVTLYDGSNLPATVVGLDPANDLAIIKINPPPSMHLTTIPFGDSSKLEVGRKVYAIGNPFGLERTLTQGIVSSIGRTLKTENGRLIKGIIQTDAAINPGNSGGPLLNSAGQMIAINTAILSRSGQSAGIGFAIPINNAKRIIPELIAHHRVNRPDLGILMVQPTELGLRVIKLDPNGPAAEAGLSGPKLSIYQNGPFTISSFDNTTADIIVAVDNVKTATVDNLMSYIESKKAGQIVTLNILRQGKNIKIPVKLSNSGQE